MNSNRFGFYENQSEILKSIADNYSESSPEYQAIRHGSLALLFALSEHPDEFVAWIRQGEQELTEEQKAHLQELGLDSDH